MGLVLGIDLGTTYSCAAVLKDDKVIMIPGDDGRNVMASFVYFDETGEILTGNDAVDSAYINRNNGIFGVKRFIGRSYEEVKNAQCMSKFPYKVIERNDKPIIEVEYKKNTCHFHPEEISAKVLSKLKERAEEFLGSKIKKAIISVPAHFNGVQRKATIDAGKVAGFHVLRIINEPTAAIIAFEMDNKYSNKTYNILVYDFGGGTFDVSIASIENSKINILASNGEAYLGGDDLTNNLIEHFIKRFKEQHDIDLNKEIEKDRRNRFYIERLRNQAEKTKIMLSTNIQYTARIDYFYTEKDIDLQCNISRSLFENMNMSLFNKTIECVEKTLKDANMKKEYIDEILLVGGSTRIPYVKQLVKRYFGKEPNMSVHPDEVVAIGAARVAANYPNSTTLSARKLVDVCSISLGTDLNGNITDVIIPRNTKIPTKVTKPYFTTEDNQKSMSIGICEGEQPLFADNKLIAKFGLINIREAKKGETKMNLTYDVDANGLLKASAVETGTNNTAKIEVSIYKNNLINTELQDMIARAEQFRKEDEARKAIAILQNDLEDKCYYIKNKVEGCNMSEFEKHLILYIHDEIKTWLTEAKNVNKTDIEKKLAHIEKECILTINKYL